MTKRGMEGAGGQERGGNHPRLSPAMRDALHVKVEPTTIAGVKAYIVTPDVISPANRNRLLIYFHGGGFILRPGEAGLAEAVWLPGLGHL